MLNLVDRLAKTGDTDIFYNNGRLIGITGSITTR